MLDFGCGSARVLRHFLPETDRAEFWGCDIDGASVDWVNANLCPPLHCIQNGPEPPLALAAESFDLIWATSVFTHIEHWSGWLLELHRILVPGGILIASFLGEGMWEALVGEPYRENEVSMTVRRHWARENADVLHSEWWLREHWGRAFEIVKVARPPRLVNGLPQTTHSYIVVTKGAATPTREELERCDPQEPRELAGLQSNVRLLRAEAQGLAGELESRAWLSTLARRAVRRSPLREPARKVRRLLQSRTRTG